MKSFLRPSQVLGAAALAGLALLAPAPAATAQSGMAHILREINPLLNHSSPGYLGVLVGDVDQDSATKLKLKDTHGALITLIDHDAPAGQTGLRVNDVVLAVDGQAVGNSEQFSRIMREVPAGHKVKLEISRDGAPQSFTIQLVDRKAMEHDVWNKMNNGDAFPPPPSGMGILPSGGDASLPGFHMPFFGSSLNVGAMVEPLTSQMADYLDVPSGVMVKQVARRSDAANAGLRAFDVILKVGGDPIKTTADWDRAVRSNKGKSVPVTILRDRKQETLNLQVDSKHKSEVEWQDLFPQGQCPQLAELAQGAPLITPEQMEELRREADQLRDSFNPQALPQFKIDPQQTEDLKRQMEQFRQSFNLQDLRIDPKQIEELRRQMEQFKKDFPQQFQLNREQMNQLQQQLEQLRTMQAGQPV